MTSQIHDPGAMRRAQDRAEAKLRFYKHLAGAAALTLLFLVINLLTSRGHWWFIWPSAAVWLSVGLHAFKIFGGDQAQDKLRQRLVEKELAKEKERGQGQS